MLPDNFLTRSLVRTTIAAVDSLPFFALVHSVAAYWCYPAPPSVALTLGLAPVEAADFLFQHRLAFSLVSIWLALEVLWFPVARLAEWALDRGLLDAKQEERISSEERWRLFVKILESTEDPKEWLQSFFLQPGKRKAPRGADDPAIQGVDLEKIGRTNIEEFVAYFMFSSEVTKIKSHSVERLEMNAMIQLLEATFTLSRSAELPPFKFLKGRSPHQVYRLSRERLSLGHKPLIFYIVTWFASQGGCLMLYLAGFRYFGQRTTWPLPLRCSSPASLESVHDAHEHLKMRSSRGLSSRTSYWYKPATGKAREEDARPIVFCHGISGCYGPSCFISYLSHISSRAMFIPVHPYLSMRLSSPSTIITRLEYVASIRRMLWRHGFGLTCLDKDEDDPLDYHETDEEEAAAEMKRASGSPGGLGEGDEDWRRGKCIVVAHSAGASMAGWLMRDAPDIVAGLVLIDPMSFLLYCPDSARNFYRSQAKSAGEYFFKYFASERGINHYMSRHVLWSNSTLFSPRAVSPLPSEIRRQVVPNCARWTQEAGYDVPRYAAEINSLQDEGAFPTVVFLSGKDCILPVPKLLAYFSKSKFGKIVEGTTASRLRKYIPPLPPRPPPAASSTSTDLVPKTGNSIATSNGGTVHCRKEEVSNEVEERKGHDDDDDDNPEEGSVRVMTGLEHAAILLSPGWCREVAKSIDQVGIKAEQWEQRERIDLLQ